MLLNRPILFFVRGSGKSSSCRRSWQDFTHCLVEVLQLRNEFICESSVAVADQCYVLIKP